MADRLCDAGGLCSDTNKGDRSPCLLGEECEVSWQEQSTPSKALCAVALCTVMRLRLRCAKNHCQNRISVCVYSGVEAGGGGVFLYRQLWAVVRPMPP